MGELNQLLSSLADAKDGEGSFRRIVAEDLTNFLDWTEVMHILDSNNVEGFSTKIPQRILNLDFATAVSTLFQESIARRSSVNSTPLQCKSIFKALYVGDSM